MQRYDNPFKTLLSSHKDKRLQAARIIAFILYSWPSFLCSRGQASWRGWVLR